jgi:hypothetical protein
MKNPTCRPDLNPTENVWFVEGLFVLCPVAELDFVSVFNLWA